jgi:tetratricopeptide (TPR) repeat protein
MKKLLYAIIATVLVNFGGNAQAIKTPAPSPTQTIKQDFALSSIEIVYSRPNMKGRVVFGDLAPYGKLWRTGANGATKVTFGEDVKVGGVAVKAGSYVLYTIPNKDEWEVILNKGLNNWGVDGYKAEEDVAKFKVKPMTLPMNIETFTMNIANVMPTSTDIQIMWEKSFIAIPVVAEIDAKIAKSIDNAMNVDNRPYFQAASYYFETGKDLSKALSWADKAIENNPKAFWIMHLKAKIQAKLGDKAAATKTANESIASAKEAKNDDYVALNEKLIATLK